MKRFHLSAKNKELLIVTSKIVAIELIIGLFIAYVILPMYIPSLHLSSFSFVGPLLLVFLTAPMIAIIVTNPYIETKHNFIQSLEDEQAKTLELYNENQRILQAHSDELEKEVKNAVAQLALSEERYMLAAKGANDGLFDWNIESKTIYFSERWKEIIGYRDDEIPNTPNEWISRIHPEDLAKFNNAIESSTLSMNNENHECEYRIEKKDRSYLWVLTRWTTLYDENNRTIRIVGSQSNINKRKNMELKLLYSASYDSLTGLANRTILSEKLINLIASLKHETSTKYALMLLDIDDFKMINDSLGHLAGDDLLAQVAKKIKAIDEDAELIARLGGDEFAIIQAYTDENQNHFKMAEKLIKSLEEEFIVHEMPLKTSMSIGIAEITKGYRSSVEIIRDADIALYQAKSDTNLRYKLFQSEMRDQQNKLFILSQDLTRSIKEEQISVSFQPIIEIENNAVCGFEALLRWNHPDFNNVTPDYFIPIAEKSRFIADLFRYVLMTTCEFLKSDLQQRNKELYISINMSGYQFNVSDVAHDIATALQFYDIKPELLKIEITESTLIDFKSSIGDILIRIHELGIPIALDDFGTGYSSINALYQFPFDFIKIDKSLIKDLSHDQNCQQLVLGISQLVKNLNKKIIAEGVENLAQLEILRAMNVHFAQGFYYSRALPSDKILIWYDEYQTSSRHGQAIEGTV